MPFTLAQRLQNLGVQTRLALEIQRQITAGAGNIPKLMEVGMTDEVAKLLAPRITAKTMTNAQGVKLAEMGMIPAVVKILQTAVAA